VWDIINPKNSAGRIKFMEEAPCLPDLFPYVTALRKSENAASKIMALFQFLAYFGKQEVQVGQNAGFGEKVFGERTSESWYGIFRKSL
jgi:hypothetical protein